jgi:hypothetical protein
MEPLGVPNMVSGSADLQSGDDYHEAQTWIKGHFTVDNGTPIPLFSWPMNWPHQNAKRMLEHETSASFTSPDAPHFFVVVCHDGTGGEVSMYTHVLRIKGFSAILLAAKSPSNIARAVRTAKIAEDLVHSKEKGVAAKDKGDGVLSAGQRDSLAILYFAKGNRPYSEATCEEFRLLTGTQMTGERVKNEVSKLMKFLDDNVYTRYLPLVRNGGFAIDDWKARDGERRLGIRLVGWFLQGDGQRVPVNIAVGFERVVGSASAQNLKAILDGLCQRHGLTYGRSSGPGVISYILGDTWSGNPKVAQLIGIRYFPCWDHVLSLVEKRTLFGEDVKVVFAAISKVNHKIYASPTEFGNLCAEMGQDRRRVRAFSETRFDGACKTIGDDLASLPAVFAFGIKKGVLELSGETRGVATEPVGDAELAEEDIILEDGEESTLHGHLALESPDLVLGEPLQSRSPLLARAAAVFGYSVNGSSFANARANVKQARGQMQRMSAVDFEHWLRIIHNQQVMYASFSAMLSSDGFDMALCLFLCLCT